MKKVTIGIAIAAVLTVLVVGVAGAITNGTWDSENYYSNVALIFTPIPGTNYGYLCTGTAISETRVVSAAHCFYHGDQFIGDFVYVIFDHDGQPFTEFYYGTATPDPGFILGGGDNNGLPGFDTHDVALVTNLLAAPFPGPYSDLPEEGMVDDLKMRQDLTVVGYGIQGYYHGNGWPFDDDIFDWRRYYAPVELINSNHVHSDEYIKLTANPGQGTGGTCFGDSGGPVFLETDDGLTIIAVTSYGTNYNCAGVGYYNRIDLDYALDLLD
jgi:hypothetical protein